MHRDSPRLANATFDLLVIGGGVVGACIARDAALRGLNVALIDKQDFSGATSAHNSKLIHGGLRYLKNCEFALVRESLRERRIWQRIAPHLVQPLPFLVPLFDAGRTQRLYLDAGLTLYDLLSFDKHWLDDPSQRLPNHCWLSRGEAVAREPVLDFPAFAGAFLYYDAQMYAPERLALECLVDASANGAVIANYVAASGLLLRKGRVIGAAVHDVVSGEDFAIAAEQTVLAIGPWTDLFLERALDRPPARKLRRSKGIHVIVPARTRQHALTVMIEDTHFFVMPWRGHTLLGTTDTAFSAEVDAVSAEDGDIDALLALVGRHLPTADLKREDVQYAYAGLRPLVDDGSANTYATSRRAEIINHRTSDNISGLLSVIGGKWTSARHLAETAVDAIVALSGISTAACSTATEHLPGGRMDRFADFERGLRRDNPGIAGIDHLARQYGSRVREVLAIAQADPQHQMPVGPAGDIIAAVVHAAREEMAVTLTDAVVRRTGIGQLGPISRDSLVTAAAAMAIVHGWSRARQQSEIDAVSAALTLAGAPPTSGTNYPTRRH